MKTRFFVLLLLIVAALTPTAAAQATTNNTSGGGVDLPGVDDVDPEQDCTKHIDNDTSICRVDHVGDDRVRLLIHTERLYEQVMLVDGADVRRGGSVDFARYPLREGLNTVEMPYSEYKGYSGVTVSTGDGIWSVPLNRQRALLPGSASTSDILVSTGATFLLFVVCIPGTWLAVKRVRGGEHREL